MAMQSLYYLLIIGSFIGPLLFLFYFVFRNRSLDKGSSTFSFSVVATMALQYVIAYNLVFFIQELFLTLGKNWIGLTAYLYHNNHNWEGSDPRTALLQGSGALSIFIFGILLALAFAWIRNRNVPIWKKTFILWLSLHGLMQSVPQVTTAFVASTTDTGQAFAYLRVGEILGFMIATASIFMLVLLSRWYLIQFSLLGFLDSGSLRAQLRSAWLNVIIPIFIGSVLIIPYRIMPWDKGFNQFFNLIPWLPWFILFAAKSSLPESIIKHRNKNVWIWFFTALAILLVFQIFLAPGIVFEP